MPTHVSQQFLLVVFILPPICARSCVQLMLDGTTVCPSMFPVRCQRVNETLTVRVIFHFTSFTLMFQDKWLSDSPPACNASVNLSVPAFS